MEELAEKKNKFFSYSLFSKKKKKKELETVPSWWRGKTQAKNPLQLQKQKGQAPLHHLYISQRAVELGLLNPHPFALLLTRCCRFHNTYFAFQQWKCFVPLCFLTIPYSLTPVSPKHPTILTPPHSNSELPQTQPTCPLAPHS